MKRPTMKLAGTVVLATAALSTSGCGADSSVPESDAAAERVVEGTIRQVGGAPVARTQIETETGPIVIAGPLALEIARAAGAVARVHGTSGVDNAPDVIQANTYELLSVDGLTPLVGLLDLDDRNLVLRTADGLRAELIGGSARMREAAGSKVWVTTRDDGVSIVRWGILNPPGS